MKFRALEAAKLSYLISLLFISKPFLPDGSNLRVERLRFKVYRVGIEERRDFKNMTRMGRYPLAPWHLRS
jgi:hypothetical protein